jgi:hypothetical protein
MRTALYRHFNADVTPLRILIACECSGEFRRACRALGHDAVSCDLKPAEDCETEHHITGDAIAAAYGQHWDGMIAHPVCRYLANSGAKHLYLGGKAENGPDPDRWARMGFGAAFYLALWRAPIERVAIENPVMHGHARRLFGLPKGQTVQPWWFGAPEFKGTTWAVRGLPKLQKSGALVPPKPGTAEHREWSRVHRMPPGPDREADRSRTLPAVAAAIAEQWFGRMAIAAAA